MHRPVSIESIWFNPFTMALTVRGFLVKERQGSATAVSFDELYANLELKSLFRWAPVFKELRLTKPYISLIRNEDRTYNFTDLIEDLPRALPRRQAPRRGLRSTIFRSWTAQSTLTTGRNRPST